MINEQTLTYLLISAGTHFGGLFQIFSLTKMTELGLEVTMTLS